MDRREALRRLAVGGATVAGATAVVSQPAFAFTNPTVTGSPTVSITTDNGLQATINRTNVPAGSCPASATTTPAPAEASLTWETFWPGGNQVMSAGSGPTVTIPGAFTQWFFNDRIRVTLVYRYQCVYVGSTAEICVRWFREFRSTGFGAAAGWQPVAGSSTGPTQVACPTAAATLSVTPQLGLDSASDAPLR